MVTIHIRVGAPYEVMHPDRRAAAKQLADELRHSGHDVELEVVEYVPGRRGLGPFETIWVTIAAGTGTTITSLLITDLHNRVKRWAQNRHENKRARGEGGRGTAFTILGPDGKVLRQWNSRDGEKK